MSTNQYPSPASPPPIVDLTQDPEPAFAPAAGVPPPYSARAVFLLMVLSFGVYLPFWMYRFAREAGRLSGRPRAAWGYPFALLISPLAAILVNRLVAECQERGGGTPITPGTCGWSLFAGMFAASIAFRFDSILPWLVSPLLLALGALPAEMALQTARADEAATRRRTVLGLAPWHALPIVAGAMVWAIAVFLVVSFELPRLNGLQLAAGTPTALLDGAFRITAPVRGWSLVGPDAEADAVERLVGPELSEASFYRYADFDLDELAANRREAFGEELRGLECSQERAFEDAHGAVVMIQQCEGQDIGGRTRYVQKVLDDGEEQLEVLVNATSESRRDRHLLESATALARSFEYAP